jgi:phosphate:Na+ symporter
VSVTVALFGGVALLLYGIRLSGEALQRALGARLRTLLTGVTRNRLVALATGALVTAVIQSSSATTIMLIGFVAAGLMSFPQTLGVILGADIGTTVTVQLIAFRVTDWAPLLIGLGFTTAFLAGRRIVKDAGQALLGFGLLFLGLKLILDGVAPIKESALAIEVLASLATSPVAAMVAGAALSALLASSTATIGIAIALATAGLLSLPAAVGVVVGANVGTCSTALAASMGANADAKRVAVAHIAFKLFGALVVFPMLEPFATFAARSATDPGRQIANAHTMFNIGISLLFLPFMSWAARLIQGVVADDEPTENPLRTRYLDERSRDQPSLALGQATREALRMSDVVQGMLRDTVAVFRGDEPELIDNVERRDDQVDFLEREIKLFLTRLNPETMAPDLARKEFALISLIGNLENIGDIIDKNLMELARKRLAHGRKFSDEGWSEIVEFHGMISGNLETAIAAFAAGDRRLAQEVLDRRPAIRRRERELRESHLARLRAGRAESLDTSDVHLDVLTNLKRISSHITAIAVSILEEV